MRVGLHGRSEVTAPKPRQFSSSIGKPPPVMFPRRPVGDHAFKTGDLIFDWPTAYLGGLVSIRNHASDRVGRV